MLLWHGGVVLACRVDEVTEKTVVLWAQPDCGSEPAKRAYRYQTRDVTWLERVPEEPAPAWDPDCYHATGYPVTPIFRDPTGVVDANPVDVVKHYAETALGLELTKTQLATLAEWRAECERSLTADDLARSLKN